MCSSTAGAVEVESGTLQVFFVEHPGLLQQGVEVLQLVVLVEDVSKSEARQQLGADQLLLTRPAPGREHRAPPRDKRFEGRVVARHLDDAMRPRERRRGGRW